MSGQQSFFRRHFGVIASHAFLIVFTVMMLIPLGWVLRIAFDQEPPSASSLSFIPQEFTFQHFQDVILLHNAKGDWVFGHQLLNSVVVSIATTLLGIFLATTAAYAFSRFEFPGKRTGLMAFLVSQMFPGVLMMIPLYVIMQSLEVRPDPGLLDDRHPVLCLDAEGLLRHDPEGARGVGHHRRRQPAHGLREDHAPAGAPGHRHHGALLVHDGLERVRPGLHLHE
jgi:ABC-type maltose transport system permease subunit